MKIPESFLEPKKVSFVLSLGVLFVLTVLAIYFRSGNKVAPAKSIQEIKALWKSGKTALALGEIEYAFYSKINNPELLRLRSQIYLEQKNYSLAFEDLKQLLADQQATLLEKYHFSRLAEYLWGKAEALNLLEDASDPILLSYKNWIQFQLDPTVPPSLPIPFHEEQQAYLNALLLMQQEQWSKAQELLRSQSHSYARYHFALCALQQPEKFAQGYKDLLELANQSFFPALLIVGYEELRERRLMEAETYFQKARELVPECLWSQWGWLETQLRMNRLAPLNAINAEDFPLETTEHAKHTFHLDYPIYLENFPYPHLKKLYKHYSLHEQRAHLNWLTDHPEIVTQQFQSRAPLSNQGKLLQIKALLANKDYEVAQEYLTHLIKENPHLVEAYELQAELALLNQKIEEAKSAIYSALKLAPKKDVLYYWLGQIYEKQGEITRANNAYLHALSLKKNTSALIRLLQIFTQSKQFDKALELFQNYPQTYPSVDYLITVGKLLVATQNYEKALTYWNLLLEMDSPKILWWEVYWNKALCMKVLRDDTRWIPFVRKTLASQPPEAIREQALQFFIESAEWSDVLEYLPPQHLHYQELKIRALMGLRRYEEVLALLNPDQFQDVPDLLRLYRLQKNWSAQIRLLLRWIPLKPDRSYLLYELAEAYFYKEEDTKALQALQTLLKQDPSFVSGWMLQGEILLRQQHYREAIASFEEAIQRYPSLAKAYYLKGKAHHILGEYEQAQADYQKAIQHDASYIRLRY